MTELTIAILAKNAETTIAATLASVQDLGTILVGDDGSTDRTRELAIQAGAQVVSLSPTDSFAEKRNQLLFHCKTTWTLFLDSDETLPEETRQVIRSAIQTTTVAGYRMPRQDILFGTRIRHGESGSLTFLRLAQTQAGTWTRPVHEVWQIEGTVRRLYSPILHTPHNSVSAFLTAINTYSSIEASQRKHASYVLTILQLLLYPVAKFLVNYGLRRGFLDGFPGFLQAFMMSLHSFAVRVKILERHT